MVARVLNGVEVVDQLLLHRVSGRVHKLHFLEFPKPLAHEGRHTLFVTRYKIITDSFISCSAEAMHSTANPPVLNFDYMSRTHQAVCCFCPSSPSLYVVVSSPSASVQWSSTPPDRIGHTTVSLQGLPASLPRSSGHADHSFNVTEASYKPRPMGPFSDLPAELILLILDVITLEVAADASDALSVKIIRRTLASSASTCRH